MHIRVTGPHDRANVVLADRPLVFGRDPHCDVVLEDPGVSHRHLVVQRTPYGVEVADLGSANGVTLDGAPFRRGLVTPGHVLRIGATTLTFDLRDEVVSHVAPTLVGARLAPPAPAQPPYVAPGARGPSPSAPAYVPPGPPGHAPRRRKGSVVGVLLVLGLVLGGLAVAGFFVWTRFGGDLVSSGPSGASSGVPSSGVPSSSPVGSGPTVGIEPLVFDKNPFEAE